MWHISEVENYNNWPLTHLAVRERLRSDWLERGLVEQPELALFSPHCDQVALY